MAGLMEVEEWCRAATLGRWWLLLPLLNQSASWGQRMLQWLLLLRWGIGEALKERSDLLLLRLLLLLDGLLEGLHGSKEGSEVRKNRWNRSGEDFGVGVFVVGVFVV